MSSEVSTVIHLIAVTCAAWIPVGLERRFLKHPQRGQIDDFLILWIILSLCYAGYWEAIGSHTMRATANVLLAAASMGILVVRKMVWDVPIFRRK